MDIIELNKIVSKLKKSIKTKENLKELIYKYDKKANETTCKNEAVIFSQIQFELESLLKD